MSARLAPVDPKTSKGKTRDLLDAVQRQLGVTPNMMRTMAQSPAVLDGYLALATALAHGALPPPAREQLALAVAEVNGCTYCASAHTLLGQRAGLTAAQADAARHGRGADPKSAAALALARSIVATRGNVKDADLSAARAAGLTDAEIAEVVAHVGLNVFTNYFNQVASTELDFPRVDTATALPL
jgi:uncharacterized peroxidase-related enzyme